MNKKIIAVLLSAVLALSLAACGGSTSSQAPASSESPASSSAPAEEASSQDAASVEAPAESSEESQEASGEALDVEAYLAEVEGLNEAAGSFALVMQEVTDAATSQDVEVAKAGLAKLREAAQPFYDFAELTAPAAYEEAHAALAGSCKELADLLVQSADMMEAILNGEEVDMEAYNSLSQKLPEVIIALSQNMVAVEDVAA